MHIDDAHQHARSRKPVGGTGSASQHCPDRGSTGTSRHSRVIICSTLWLNKADTADARARSFKEGVELRFLFLLSFERALPHFHRTVMRATRVVSSLHSQPDQQHMAIGTCRVHEEASGKPQLAAGRGRSLPPRTLPRWYHPPRSPCTGLPERVCRRCECLAVAKAECIGPAAGARGRAAGIGRGKEKGDAP
jgi:hypothetical protein